MKSNLTLKWPTWLPVPPPRVSRKVWILFAFLPPYVILFACFILFGRFAPPVVQKPLAVFFYPAQKVADFILSRRQAGSDLTEVPLKALRVSTSEVMPKIESVGTIDFFEKVEINAKSSGRIEKFFVREGQIVEKNQPLVQLERTFLELDLAQQQAAFNGAGSELKLANERYENARRVVEGRFQEHSKQTTLVKRLFAEMERMRVSYAGRQVLYQEGGISKEDFETARTELIGREAAYRMAQRDLEIASIGLRDQDLTAKGIAVPTDPEARTKALIKLNTAVELAEVEVAQSRLKSAEAAMNTTKVLLKESLILSPIKGMVAARSKSVGEQVLGGSAGNAAQAIMILVDINRVYAVMNVKESDLKQISQGMRLQFVSDAYEKEKFDGKIEIINPIVDAKTHTFEVRAILDNPGLKLRPGMFIRSSIITGKPVQMILVPAAALLPQEEAKAYVFLVRDGKIFRSEVATGDSRGDDVEVKSGLKPGDIIVTEKVSQLREGMKIKPVISE